MVMKKHYKNLLEAILVTSYVLSILVVMIASTATSQLLTASMLMLIRAKLVET
jgi:hypothetical protein